MRYQVVEDSQSGHCCFDATVVDTSKLEIINGEHRKEAHAAGRIEAFVAIRCRGGR